jgi:hypothetical protein
VNDNILLTVTFGYEKEGKGYRLKPGIKDGN